MEWTDYLEGGRIIIRHGEREWIWGCADQLLVAAIERAFRRRLTNGESVFFASATSGVQGRSFATVVIPPSAFVSFSYSDYDGEELGPIMVEVEDLVARNGGITLDADDNIVAN